MPTQTVIRSAVRRHDVTYENWYCNGVSAGSGTYSPLVASVNLFEKSRTWVRVPNFAALRRNRQPLPENPYSYYEKRVADREISFTTSVDNSAGCPGHPWDVRSYYSENRISTAFWGPDEGDTQLTQHGLLALLSSRARGPEFSVPTFVGEGRQTIQMVSQAATTIAQAYRDLRRGNIIGAFGRLAVPVDTRLTRRYNRDYGRDPTRAAANHWLALTYGWRPLVNDVYNAAETLAETLLGESSRIGRVTARTRLIRNEIGQHQLGVSPSVWAKRTRVIKETYRGVWKFEPTDWNTWGSFGVTNPASVAWELLPFSFVVDWFLPVGRYLEGLDTNLRFKHLGGTIGYRREVNCYYSNIVWDGRPVSGEHETNYVGVVRQPMASNPVLGVDSITFQPNLGGARIASAMALLRQNFGR